MADALGGPDATTPPTDSTAGLDFTATSAADSDADPVGVAAVPNPPSRLRVFLSVVVGIGVTVAAFAVLIPQLGSYEQALVKLGQMPGIWITSFLQYSRLMQSMMTTPCSWKLSNP